MTEVNTDINELFKEVCTEFQSQGFKKDVDPRTLKESYNVVKQADGQWFKSTKAGLHEVAERSDLPLHKMPALEKLISLIDEKDSEIKKEGGRIFISEVLVYKIVKGTHHPILFAELPVEKKIFAKNAKLCEEILLQGLEKDRYRVEETYILTKAANGVWSMNSSHENYSETTKNIDLDKMPLLKAIAVKLNKIDPQFKSNGGRIFITPTRIYRVKNKVELDFKI